MDFRLRSVRAVMVLGAAALLAACGGGGGGGSSSDAQAGASASVAALPRAVVLSVESREQPATAAQDVVRVKDLAARPALA
ncbi:serine protease, partial [Acidovorax cattleyae]|nr:serine protease [Paracidovorax cattleyae]